MELTNSTIPPVASLMLAFSRGEIGVTDTMGSPLAILEAAHPRRPAADEAFGQHLAGLAGVHVQVEPVNADAERDGCTRADIQADVEAVLRRAGMALDSRSALFVEVPGTPVLHVDVMTIRLDGRYAYSVRLELWEAVTPVREPRTPGPAMTWSAPQLLGTVAADNLEELREVVRSAVTAFVDDCRASAAREPGAAITGRE